MKLSTITRGAIVPFPAFMAESVYMRRFERGERLPRNLSRWQATVDAMLDGVISSGPVYLMIDQRIVLAGENHRRPGLHVDGYWFDGLQTHGPSNPSPPGHRPLPSPSHTKAGSSGRSEALIIASDALGCRGFEGEWHGEFRNGGDCSDVPRDKLAAVDFEAGRAWIGETGALLHESIPLRADAMRTVVRLNVTGLAA